jgi:hypothetical protein
MPILVISEVWYNFWGGDNESKIIFKLQKKVIWTISGVNKHRSYRQIFKNCNILTVASLYILEVIYYIKKYKDSLVQNVHIHNNNIRIKTGFTYTYLHHSILQEKWG